MTNNEDSMSKHTPGPWTVGEKRGLKRGNYIVFPLPEDDEIDANARLIAAAPDLLAALKKTLRAAVPVERGELASDMLIRLSNIGFVVRAAITKAEG